MESHNELLARAQREACGCDDEQDWCRICNRPTCHWGEHSDEQLLAFIGVDDAPRPMTEDEIAEAYARATGSVGATYRVDRRMEDGSLLVEAEGSWRR